MSEKIMNITRVVIKALLCVSLIIAVGLLLNYIRNLNPTTDGFDVTSMIARLIHSDGYWTWKKLTSGLYTSFGFLVVLFCIDKVLDMFCLKKKQ